MTTTTPTPPGAPGGNAFARFFDDMPLTREQVVGYRFILFATLAVDAFLRIPYATRPGMCGFNAAHFAWLDVLPGPTPLVMHVLLLGQVWLGLLHAVGAGTRRTLVLHAGLYGASYFWSVSDSYAHHYMGFLILGMWCFSDPDDVTRVRWPFRLMMVQYAIVYFWAALGKLMPTWVSGEMMMDMLPPDWMRLGVFKISQLLHMDILGLWSFFSKSVVITEMLLAFGMVFNAVRPLLFVVGIGLHGFILLMDLKIGQFSWFMFCGYALVLPDAWRDFLWNQARRIPWPRVRWDDRAPAWLWVGSIVLGIAALTRVPIDAMVFAAGLYGVFLVVTGPSLRRVMVQLGACAVVLVLAQTSQVVLTVLEGLGVGLTSCGRLDAAKIQLDRLVETYPDYSTGLVEAADLRVGLGKYDEARELYRRALDVDPGNGTAREHLASIKDK